MALVSVAAVAARRPAAVSAWALGGWGSASGSHTLDGTDWPMLRNPHSCTHRRRSATDVWPVSKVTLEVCATGLASTRATPGRRPSTRSATAFSLAQFRPPTCKTVVTVVPGARSCWGIMPSPSHRAAWHLARRGGVRVRGGVEDSRTVRGAEPDGPGVCDPVLRGRGWIYRHPAHRVGGLDHRAVLTVAAVAGGGFDVRLDVGLARRWQG